MLVLKQTTDIQEILFLPRTFEYDRIAFTNEQNNTTVSHDVTPDYESYFAKAELELDLIEGQFYVMKVYGDDEVVYYGKVFCTNQDIEDYSINDGVYKDAPSTQNEYITV